MTYEFQYGDMQFSKTGQLDELIALDRYAMTAYDGYEKGDTVVAIVDEVMGTKKVGTIIDGPSDGVYQVKDRLGELHTVKEGLLQKPLETEPKQFWERWAKGGASVESKEVREDFENELRWLFDGYKYSMGGRVQLMLGQESVSGEKSPLTAYNCFVVRSPRPKASSVEQFLDVVEVARIEATIMRRGGGVGLNISPIYTVKGSGASPNDFEFILPKGHPDSEELSDRKLLGKFDGVRVSTEEYNGEGVIVAEDSVEGLFEGIKRMVKRSYDGHSVVVDFGGLRERNALVKGVNGRSSGAVSWMELYVLAARLLQRDSIDAVDFAEMFSEIVHLIIQGGSRRGALMLVCNDDSPVVHKFMERKKLPGYLTGANISVGISDSFMERVKAYKDGVVSEETSEANRLWMTLIESAHASAEPGILLLERYNKESNSWYYNEIVSSNPCLRGDMRLLTDEGYQKFEDLAEKGYANIVNKDGEIVRGRVWETGDKPTVRIKFSDKSEIYSTEDHRFMTVEGEEIEASNLKGKKVKPYINYPKTLDPKFQALGFIQGDGTLTDMNNKDKKGVSVNVGEKDVDVKEFMSKEFLEGKYYKSRHWYTRVFNEDIISLGFYIEKLPERPLPKTYKDWDFSKKQAFLNGLFSANGSVLSVGRVTFKTTCRILADQLVSTLESDFGISAYITTNKSKENEFSNGTYTMRESYDVNISKYKDRVTFFNTINFIHTYKKEKLYKSLVNDAPKVTSVKFTGNIDKVYDFNEPSTNWGVVEGVITHNCGEQGLPEFGVCNLGHFVLPTFYNEETNDVNWSDLERAIKAAVRLQDNIIDYTDYFLEENEKVQKAERRVGIGSMGLGTMLIRMGLRYGADDGNEFTDKLYKFIAYHAYKASIELAKEKGAFEKFEYDKFIQSGFMKRMLSEFPDLDEGLRKYGIRNVTLLTQAPTGSTGTYIDNIPDFRKKFGGTTTGIEPYFSWKYWRAGRLGMAEQTVDLAQEYLDEHGLSDISELPRHFVTAMELSPLEHVKAQAAVQKWTDSSISKTANCPRDYTVDQTDELYREAYDLGLKGMTIYRDGSRDSQVLATNEEDAKLETHIEADKLKKLKSEASAKSTEEVLKTVPTIKKVPARLYGMREKVKYHSDDKVRKAYVHIYLDEGTPVEVWIEPTEVVDKDLADALGRMTTQFLRFGVTENNVDQAVKHLKKGKSMFSLPTVVGRLIEQVYYGKIEMPTFANDDKPKQFEFQKCPECGEKAYDKGNCICHACGKSNCN